MNKHGELKAMYFPPGFRFEPKDEELILYYLLPKICNQELPPNLMHEVNLYQNEPKLCDPDKLTAHNEPQGDGKWYFFTSRDRKYPNGSRPNRAAGSGYWKATGSDTQICKIGEHEGGFKKVLVFYIGKPGAEGNKKTNWLMHEYRVGLLKIHNDLETHKRKRNNNDEASTSQSMKLNEWVLCKIYLGNNEEKGKTKSKEAEDCAGTNKEDNGKDEDKGQILNHGVKLEANQPIQSNIVPVANSVAKEQQGTEQQMHYMNIGFQSPFIDPERLPSSAQPIGENIVLTDSFWSDLESIPFSSMSKDVCSTMVYDNTFGVSDFDFSGLPDFLADFPDTTLKIED